MPRGKKVMILDPSAFFRRTLKEVIHKKSAQVEVSEAKNADQAKTIIEKNPPDVVFFDIALPTENGIDFIAAIKGLVPQSRVVILTGHDSAEYESAALSNGADYFLSKQRSSGFHLIDVIETTVLSSGS